MGSYTTVCCWIFAFCFVMCGTTVKAQQVEPEIFTKTEINANYPGRMPGWFDFVERNFDFKSLSGSVKVDSALITVRFVVGTAGQVSNIAYSSGDSVLFKPVSALIEKSGKWKPALQCGREVKAYRSLKLRFGFNHAKKVWEFVRDPDDYIKNWR